MQPVRRQTIRLLAAGIAAPWVAHAGGATGAAGATRATGATGTGEAWTPQQPMRIITWAGAGSAFDVLARMLAENLGKRWAATVTVENRTGAGGIVGTDAAVRARPDGSTILITTNSAHILNQLLKAKLPFDTARDLQAVSKLADGQTVLAVAADAPYKTLKEFLDSAGEGSEGRTYSSFANGSASHLLGDYLQRLSKSKLIHVPYPGGEMAALTDLVGGRLDASFMSEGTYVNQSKAGKVKGLAITGPRRTKASPDVPTYGEQGYGEIDLTGWIGTFVPTGTPPAAIAALSTALQDFVKDPEVNARMDFLGFQPVGNSAQAFSVDVEKERVRWAELVKASGFQPQ